MYLIQWYDGVWHRRMVKDCQRADRIFDEKKEAGCSRVEIFALSREYDQFEEAIKNMQERRDREHDDE